MMFLLVALGAAVGAPLRHLTDRAITARQRSRFPCGTLVVNLAGSFVLGLLIGLPVDGRLAALLGSGFCGALTTYSTFGWQTLTLAREGARRLAVANAVVSILAGLLAAWLGIVAGRALGG